MFRQIHSKVCFSAFLLFTLLIFCKLYLFDSHHFLTLHLPNSEHQLSRASSKPNSQPPLNSPTDTVSPKVFWYKAGPKGVSEQSQKWIDGCLGHNPGYSHKVLSDEQAEQYVSEKYSDREDIISLYNSIAVPILKADLLRYLILYADGGIWNDLDVECGTRSVEAWIPAEFNQKYNMVVGMEYDHSPDEDLDSSKINFESTTFATWTVMAKPGSSHLMQVIEEIHEALNDTARNNNVGIQGLTFGMIPDVVNMTGPRRLTSGASKSLGAMLGRELKGRDIMRVQAPRLVGDVLLLPQVSFAAMQKFWPEPIPEELRDEQLVIHHYAGSWKQSGGEKIEDTAPNYVGTG